MYRIILAERGSGKTTKILNEMKDNDVMIVDSKHYISKRYYGNKNVISTNSLYMMNGMNIGTLYIDSVYSPPKELRRIIFDKLCIGTNVVMYQDIDFISMDIYDEIRNSIGDKSKTIELMMKIVENIEYNMAFKKYYNYGMQAVSGEIEIRYGVL